MNILMLLQRNGPAFIVRIFAAPVERNCFGIPKKKNASQQQIPTPVLPQNQQNLRHLNVFEIV